MQSAEHLPCVSVYSTRDLTPDPHPGTTASRPPAVMLMVCLACHRMVLASFLTTICQPLNLRQEITGWSSVDRHWPCIMVTLITLDAANYSTSQEKATQTGSVLLQHATQKQSWGHEEWPQSTSFLVTIFRFNFKVDSLDWRSKRIPYLIWHHLKLIVSNYILYTNNTQGGLWQHPRINRHISQTIS